MDDVVIAAAKRIGLPGVTLGPELIEELRRDAWGSTFEFRVRNVIDHFGRNLMRSILPNGGQIEFDAFFGFDAAALATWDLLATDAGDGEVTLDLLAITSM